MATVKTYTQKLSGLEDERDLLTRSLPDSIGALKNRLEKLHGELQGLQERISNAQLPYGSSLGDPANFLPSLIRTVEALHEELRLLNEKISKTGLGYGVHKQNFMSDKPVESYLKVLEPHKSFTRDEPSQPRKGAYEVAGAFEADQIENLSLRTFRKAVSELSYDQYKSLLSAREITDTESSVRNWMQSTNYEEI